MKGYAQWQRHTPFCPSAAWDMLAYDVGIAAMLGVDRRMQRGCPYLPHSAPKLCRTEADEQYPTNNGATNFYVSRHDDPAYQHEE